MWPQPVSLLCVPELGWGPWQVLCARFQKCLQGPVSSLQLASCLCFLISREIEE